MPDNLTPDEVLIQGSAMASLLHRQVSDLVGRLAEAEGMIAVLNKRVADRDAELKRLNTPADPPRE